MEKTDGNLVSLQELKVNNGQVELKGLLKGNYKLYIPANKQTVNVTVLEGERWGG